MGAAAVVLVALCYASGERAASTRVLDPRAILFTRAPEDGLVHPIGFADELLTQTESLEDFNRAAGDAIGLTDLRRAIATLDQSRADDGEIRQLCAFR